MIDFSDPPPNYPPPSNLPPAYPQYFPSNPQPAYPPTAYTEPQNTVPKYSSAPPSLPTNTVPPFLYPHHSPSTNSATAYPSSAHTHIVSPADASTWPSSAPRMSVSHSSAAQTATARSQDSLSAPSKNFSVASNSRFSQRAHFEAPYPSEPPSATFPKRETETNHEMYSNETPSQYPATRSFPQPMKKPIYDVQAPAYPLPYGTQNFEYHIPPHVGGPAFPHTPVPFAPHYHPAAHHPGSLFSMPSYFSPFYPPYPPTYWNVPAPPLGHSFAHGGGAPPTNLPSINQYQSPAGVAPVASSVLSGVNRFGYTPEGLLSKL